VKTLNHKYLSNPTSLRDKVRRSDIRENYQTELVNKRIKLNKNIDRMKLKPTSEKNKRLDARREEKLGKTKSEMDGYGQA
jgi:hypothetical protein